MFWAFVRIRLHTIHWIQVCGENLCISATISCLHRLEGNIFQWLETRALISREVKGCFLSGECDCSILCRITVWLDLHYICPFQLYMWRKLFVLMWLYYSPKHMAWGCDMINQFTKLKYRLNACSWVVTCVKSELLLELFCSVSSCKRSATEKQSFLLLV